MKKAYLFVDPCNSGRKLVDAFNELIGNDPTIAFINIESIDYTKTVLAPPERSKYAATFLCDRNDPATIEKLYLTIIEQYQVLEVITAQECGIVVSDTLSERLGLTSTNGTAQSLARFDKSAMRRALAVAGLAYPKFITSNNLIAIKTELASWSVKNVQYEAGYPVFMKVLRSAGTDGVYRCDNEAELDAAYKRCIGHTTIMGEENTEVLVEAFLDGPEYVVNTVSIDGLHYVSDVWRYEKKHILGLGNIYDRETLMDPKSHAVIDLISYNAKMLDALGIKNGPSHAEIIMTSTGPVLVEVGARISGVVHRTMNDKCLGLKQNQVDLTALRYVFPQQFKQHIQANEHYKKNANGMVVNLINDTKQGYVASINSTLVEQMRNIDSVVEFIVRVNPGQIVEKTTTLMNSTGRIFSCNISADHLDADNERMQQLNKENWFNVFPTLQLTRLVTPCDLGINMTSISQPQAGSTMARPMVDLQNQVVLKLS